jgi:hypothetical protein
MFKGDPIGSGRAHAVATPNREELLALHRIWIDNEVLYRE